MEPIPTFSYRRTDTGERQQQVLALVEQIIALAPDDRTLAYAMKMRDRLKLPMALVLEKLWPDLIVMDKVRKLGITKQSYYGWLNELYRPDEKMAKRLAKETGFSVEEIRGRN